MRVLLFVLFFACSGLSLFPGFREAPIENSPDPESQHFLSEDGHHLFHGLLMEKITPDEAMRLFQNRKNYIQGLYENDQDPYFGRSVRARKCLEGLNLEGLKEKNQKFQSLRFDLPSDENFVLGQCNPKLENHEATLIFLYCHDSGNFHELKYYRLKSAPFRLPPDLGGVCAKK